MQKKINFLKLKTAYTILLMLVILFELCSCGNDGETSSDIDTVSSSVPTSTTTTITNTTTTITTTNSTTEITTITTTSTTTATTRNTTTTTKATSSTEDITKATKSVTKTTATKKDITKNYKEHHWETDENGDKIEGTDIYIDWDGNVYDANGKFLFNLDEWFEKHLITSRKD